MTEMPRKKTSLYIDEELYNRFTVFVVTRYGHRKLTDTIEKAMREYMENHKNDPKIYE